MDCFWNKKLMLFYKNNSKYLLVRNNITLIFVATFKNSGKNVWFLTVFRLFTFLDRPYNGILVNVFLSWFRILLGWRFYLGSNQREKSKKEARRISLVWFTRIKKGPVIRVLFFFCYPWKSSPLSESLFCGFSFSFCLLKRYVKEKLICRAIHCISL